MVSVLFVDVLALLEPVPELEVEPALQPAAASRPATMMTPYLKRRLMGSSLLPFGPWDTSVGARSRLGIVCGQYRGWPIRGLPLPRSLLGQYPNYLSGKRLRT